MPEHVRARKVTPQAASVLRAMDRHQRQGLASRDATARDSHPLPLPAERADLLGHDLSRIRVHHARAAELDAVAAAPAATHGEQITDASQAASARGVEREHALGAQLRRGGVPVDAERGREQDSPAEQDAEHAARHLSRGGAAAMATGGPGQALPTSLRARLAPLVGMHAATVARVHTDSTAHAHAADSRALAVASGPHIFFARGHYRPGNPDGDRLIAHEVAHVDQAQRDLLHEPASFLASGTSSAPLERKADQVASQLDQDPGGGEAAAVPRPEKRPGTAGDAKPDAPGPAPGSAPGPDPGLPPPRRRAPVARTRLRHRGRPRPGRPRPRPRPRRCPPDCR